MSVPGLEEDFVTKIDHFGVFFEFHVTENGVHESWYFLVVGFLIDFLGGVKGDDAFESFKGFFDSVLVKKFDCNKFFPFGLDDFLLNLHIKSCFGLGEVVNSHYNLDYWWGLGEVEKRFKLLIVLTVLE